MTGGLILREFSPTDPTRITPRPDFAREHDLSGQPLFRAQRPEGVAWTLCEGPARWAKPLACGGLSPLGFGRWAAWLFAEDLSPRGWVMVARGFNGLKVETRARRIEATVRDGAPELTGGACAFAERLGLSREGRMTGFGPDGADYWLFGGVFG
ncbi:MAG: hypothetical protein ACK4Z5_09775 [Brevundimonas sp.]